MTDFAPRKSPLSQSACLLYHFVSPLSSTFLKVFQKIFSTPKKPAKTALKQPAVICDSLIIIYQHPLFVKDFKQKNIQIKTFYKSLAQLIKIWYNNYTKYTNQETVYEKKMLTRGE